MPARPLSSRFEMGLVDHEFGSLFESAKAGEMDSLASLLEGCRPYLMAVTRRVRNYDSSDECSAIIQTCIENAIQEWPRFSGNTQNEFLHWLVQLLRQSLNAEQGHDENNVGGENPYFSDNGLHSSEARAQAARWLLQFDRLPELDQQIIELRFFANLTFDEVAMRLGKSDDAVRALAVAAIRRLARTLGDES